MERKLNLKWTLIIIVGMLIYILFGTQNVMSASSVVGDRDWRWPVPASKNISSCFPNYCGHGSIHHAIDISAAGGSAIYAMYPGTVVYTDNSCTDDRGKANAICGCGKGRSCFGKSVYIQHYYKGSYFISRYGHMRSINVKMGQAVDKNTVIGTVGSTGASTGNHLDFTIWTGTSLSKPSSESGWVDPFLNQFLEKVTNLTHIGCNDSYVDDVNKLYSGEINSAPITAWDTLEGKQGGIYIRGWAFDPDNKNAAVGIHVYIDGQFVKSFSAVALRPDVNNVYGCGDNHGFDEFIPYNVSSTGEHKVDLYALDLTYGAPSTYLGQKTVTIMADTESPVVSDITITDISENGYTIQCTITDNVGTTGVSFPTWPDANGEWNPIWHEGSNSGNTFTCRVNVSDHGNIVNYNYATHIYAGDAAGNTGIGIPPYIYVGEPQMVTESYYNGNKYRIYDTSRTWTDAQKFCEENGGHLVTITSEEEQAFVQSLLEANGAKNQYWIGGKFTDNTFKWVTGEDVSYTNWDVRQPDRSNVGNAVESYGQIYNKANPRSSGSTIYHWNDAIVDNNFPKELDFFGLFNVGFIFEEDNVHEHEYNSKVIKNATCTETGEIEYTCECGNHYKETVSALGHNYTEEYVDATCKDYAATVYTCSRCGDSYREVYESEYSDWSEQYPEGVDESLIESRTEYRYQDKEEQTSYSSYLSGWTQSGATWEESGSGTVSYVASWPSGFNTSHNLYSNYNKTPKSASETATDKTVIDSTTTQGYLYYHWCRNAYASGPINRSTKPTNSGEFNCFHAFYSTTNPSTLTASNDGDGSCIYSNGDCCKDTYWYYNVAVNRQTYTTYKKMFNYYRWSDWSDWSTTKATESSTKKVETRTVYRYETSVLGDHVYGEWTVLEEPTDTEDGVKVRTCADCGNQEFAMIEKLEAKENPFKDVEEDDYYFEPVLWALDHRITSGLTADTFAPQLGATRAEVVTFLWRAHGEPEPELETSSFEDVKATSYYSKAVRWATENGITNGYNEKEFGSKDYVTRAQFVTFLWRVEGEPDPMNAETTFTDIKTTSYYYKAVLWAVENGITLGYDQNTFAPDMTCTRGQVVTFLYRAYN